MGRKNIVFLPSTQHKTWVFRHFPPLFWGCFGDPATTFLELAIIRQFQHVFCLHINKYSSKIRIEDFIKKKCLYLYLSYETKDFKSLNLGLKLKIFTIKLNSPKLFLYPYLSLWIGDLENTNTFCLKVS